MAFIGPATQEHAQTLQQAVSDAYSALQTAKSDYERAIATVWDVNDSPNSGGILAIRKASLEYAAAVARYSEAAMALLAYVDISLTHATKYGAKSAAGE